MATNYTDIEDLRLKVNNAEASQEIEADAIPSSEYLTAEQWNTVVTAVKELQDADPKAAVKKVKFNGTEYQPDANGKVVFDQSGETTIFSLRLAIGEVNALQKDTNVSLPVKITFQQKAPLQETEDIDRQITVHVLTRANSSAEPVERGTVSIMSNLENFTDIDVSPYLTTGNNWVILRATTTVTNDYGVDVEMQSSQEKTFKVVNLALISDVLYTHPFSGDTVSLRYAVTGAIEKYLQIEVYGDREHSELQYSYSSDGNGTGIYMSESTVYPGGSDFIFSSSESIGHVLLQSGHHYVRARLFATETIKTDWVDSEIVSGQSGAAVVVNKISSDVSNWTDVTLFNWVSMISQTVVFRLTSSSDASSAMATEYATWQFTAVANVDNIFRTQLGIDIENTSITEFDAYMHIEDENGNALTEPIFFEIQNSADFAPVSGAEFVLQPSTRSNSEAMAQTIINAVDGSIVNSIWENFDMVTDGYMDVNKDVDDTSENAERIRALHVPAGRRLTIFFNALRNFINASGAANALAGKYMTLEIDFRTSNITNEDESVISLATEGTGNDIYGFEMKAVEAALLTKDKRTRDDQNVSWAEDIRTRLTVNVRYNINPDNDINGTKLNYVRIFLDDKIEREFTYRNNDSFLPEDVNLILGADNCDLDIFGIRCYQKDLSTNDVMQDYKAGLSSTAEKLAFQQKNDILGGEGTIDMQKAIDAGYNVLGYTGHLPNYKDDAASGNKGITTGSSLYVHIHNEKTRCGTYTNLETAGQGTTAMTYNDWNQSHKATDETAFIPEYAEGTAVARKAKFDLADGEPKIKKAVGKINFASSMQGHKMGLTRAYTDVFKALVANGTISEPGQITRQPNARIAVFERPFLFFHRETENDAYTFRYLMTWGAGKGDKPTFGFDEEETADMLMIEGADNDKPIAQFMAPWNDDVTYNAGKEAWYYGGEKNINFGFGVTDSNGVPSSSVVNVHKTFFNFCYLHTQNIDYYNGTFEDLIADNSKKNITDMLYWVTSASSSATKYDLFRWDVATEGWVKAGVNKETLNLRAQYETFCSEASIVAEAWNTNASANALAKSVRVAHFRKKVNDIIHVDDALYHICFIKLFAGTDNRAKNTYYYTDPDTLKIRHIQDDLDTTVKTNNVGQNRKPYYVEEFDKNSAGEYYWQGAESSYYSLLELAFPDEERSMMASMLSAMAIIGGGTVMGFMESYVLQAQNYFPGIAYNEMARLVYERASVDQADGTYVNNAADAITQSNGSQKWSEYQWLKDRIMYISSWCEYGEFSGASGAGGGLGWRGAIGSYSFTLTPAKCLYPRISQGDSNVGAISNSVRNVRVMAGESFTYATITNSTDSVITIKGINYYLRIGDMNVPTSASQQTTFTFYGKKLQEILINPSGTDANKFFARTISIANAVNIKRFIVRNVNTLDGNVDLSKCTRLQEIDMRGSTPSSVTPPASNLLTTMRLPSSLTSITLHDIPNLAALTMDGYNSLNIVDIDANTVGIDTKYFLMECKENNAPLSSVTLYGILWIDTRANFIDYLADISTINISGAINIYATDIITLAQKMKYVSRWGAIDSSNNALYITYTRIEFTGFAIGGDTYISSVGGYQYRIITSVAGTGNDISNVEWSVKATETGGTPDFILSEYVSGISSDGVLSVIKIASEEDGFNCELTCVVTKMDGTQITQTYVVGLYYHPRTIGDYVYANGSWSNRLDPSKTLVGYCYKVLNNGEYGLCYASECTYNRWPKRFGLTNRSTSVGITGIVLTDANYNPYKNSAVVSWGNSSQDDLYTLTSAIGGYSAGEVVTRSLYMTMVLIEHRNKIMTDANVALSQFIPEIYAAQHNITTFEAVDACILGLREFAQNAGVTNYTYYDQIMYPAASAAFAYKPITQLNPWETLATCFTEKHWGLMMPELSSINTSSVDNKQLVQVFTEKGLTGTYIPQAGSGTNYMWTCWERNETTSIRMSTYGTTRITPSVTNTDYKEAVQGITLVAKF